MLKDEALERWRNLPEGQNPLPFMRPIPYRAAGSKFGACGVRIDGTPEFVDAVLSNLKPLLAGEADNTRLELTRRPAASDFKGAPNAAPDAPAEVCYIRLHVRGREARIANAIYGRAKARR